MISLNMQGSNLYQKFNSIQEKVFSRRPVLGDIIAREGAMSLYDYAMGYHHASESPQELGRAAEFIETFRGEVEKRLGKNIAHSAAQQLAEHYAISTADHHGPLCHPFFLSSNLISAATIVGANNQTLRHVIVLACANISFNNSSYPRGLLLTSRNAAVQTPVALPFLPDSIRAYSVYRYPGYTEKDMQQVRNKIDKLVLARHLTVSQSQQLNSLVTDVYAAPEMFNCQSYSDQMTKTDAELWQRFFTPQPQHYPSLIYLESEMLVGQLLLQHHMSSDTVIHQILFEPRYQKLVAEKFDSIMGGFSLAEKTGTYLFWALPPGKKYRQQLWKEGGALVTADGGYRIDLTPAGITRGLTSKELIPSTLLVFILLSCYYGLRLLGGFNQVNYLTQTKQAYMSMLADLGDMCSVRFCSPVVTNKFCGDFITAFVKKLDGSLVPATGLDLVLHGQPETWDVLAETAKTISLSEAVAPMMPELYRMVYMESERDPSLTEVTKDDISMLLGLSKKIKPCVSIL